MAFWVVFVPSRAVMGLLRLAGTGAVLLTDEANGADVSTGGLFCKGSRAGLLRPTDQDMGFEHTTKHLDADKVLLPSWDEETKDIKENV